MHRNSDLRLAIFVAACASCSAGLIHLAVVPGHWREWWASGVFFVAIALFQLGWAMALLRFPRRGLVAVGVFANLASMALWAVSRLWGLPFGPHASVPEAVGVAGVMTTMLEATVVVTAIWAVLPRRQPALFSPGVFRSVAAAAVLVMGGLLVPGVAGALTHDHGGHGHGDHADHHDSDPSPARERQDRGGDTPRQPGSSPSPRQDGGTGGEQQEPEGHPDDGHTH